MSSVAFGRSLPAADRWRLVELEGWRRGEGLPCRNPPCRERGSEGWLARMQRIWEGACQSA